MKKTNTSERLKSIMAERNLKQIDILQLCKPYCEKYNVKLNKNDLSQYVSGKVNPGQDKLTVLGLALNVDEVWLMGYDTTPTPHQASPNSAPTEPPDLSDRAVYCARLFDNAEARTQDDVILLLENHQKGESESTSMNTA